MADRKQHRQGSWRSRSSAAVHKANSYQRMYLAISKYRIVN